MAPEVEQKSCACSSDTSGRNLVVCIDGISNQFGRYNTNVIELYSQIVKSDHQLTYYNSGIGTYAKPSWKSWSYIKQVLNHKIDLAIAWNFEKIVIGAYRWLSQNYQEGDRIYLFGFSRGAYQVRVLAGMIQRVGLIYKGNEEQIPFAYELYADRRSDKYAPSQLNRKVTLLQRLHLHPRPSAPDVVDLAERFKTTFSHRNVRVHFVGVWDTVSSVGIVRDRSLPLTDTIDHICFFRHALALDERRVKFLPEYVHGGVFQTEQRVQKQNTAHNDGHYSALKSTVVEVANPELNGQKSSSQPHIKEVWFPGTHSDIGGGNAPNPNLDRGNPPLQWMSYEAISGGLHLKPVKVEWDWNHLGDVKESLTSVWSVLEWLPIKRLSYQDGISTTYRLHKGKGRTMQPGQKIHASVAFCPELYVPKVALTDNGPVKDWGKLVHQGNRTDMLWARDFKDVLELDIFDHSAAKEIIGGLALGDDESVGLWFHRLGVMTWSDEGCEALLHVQDVFPRLAQLWTPERTVSPDILMGVVGALDVLRGRRDHTALGKDAATVLLSVVDGEHDARVASSAAKFLSECLLDEQSCEQARSSGIFDTLGSLLKNGNSEVVRVSLSVFSGFLRNGIYNSALFVDCLDKAGCTMLSDLRSKLSDDWAVKSEALRFLAVAADHNGLRGKIFDDDMISALRSRLSDDHWAVKEEALRVLTVIVNHGLVPTSSSMRILHHADDLRRKVFDPDTISTLCKHLSDDQWGVRSEALRTLAAAVNHDDLRGQAFSPDTISTLRRRLSDDHWAVKSEALRILAVGANNDDLRGRIFDPETILALRSGLTDDNWAVKSEVLRIPAVAANSDDLRRRVFDRDMILALRSKLSDDYWAVKEETLRILAVAMNHNDFRGRIFDNGMISALRSSLSDANWWVRRSALKILTAATDHDDLRRRVFDHDMISSLRNIPGDDDEEFRREALKTLAIAMNHGDLNERVSDADVGS